MGWPRVNGVVTTSCERDVVMKTRRLCVKGVIFERGGSQLKWMITCEPKWLPKRDQDKDQMLEEVEKFKYLRAIISNEGSKPEIHSRIAQTTAALSSLKIKWRDKNISFASNVKLMRTLILSTFHYACESWTLTAEIERRIQALEMRC